MAPRPAARALNCGFAAYGADETRPTLAVRPNQKALVYSARLGAKRALKRAKEKGSPVAVLNEEEAGAVHLYTIESPLYKLLNEHLRKRDRSAFKPFFSYVRLLLTALRKLPRREVTVFRGVKLNLSSKYPEGEVVTWWAGLR